MRMLILKIGCPSSELFEYPYSALCARMSAEKRVHHAHHALREIFRVDDIHLGNVVATYITQTRIA